MTSSGEKARPVDAWPIGSRITLLDAWRRNPVEVKIFKHWNAEHIGAEDDRGLRYYAHVGRIAGLRVKAAAPNDFDDILGPTAADEFADILG